MDNSWERYKEGAVDVEFKKSDEQEKAECFSNKIKFMDYIKDLGIYRLIDKVTMPEELKLFAYVLVLLMILTAFIAILLSWLKLLNKFIINGGAFLTFLLVLDILGIRAVFKRPGNYKNKTGIVFILRRIPLLILVLVPLPFIILGIINMFLI